MDPEASQRALNRIRIVHTLIWAVFAFAVVAIPVFTATGALGTAGWLSLLVFGEVAVLVFNGMQCPLRGVAARYTDSRADGFDILIPPWLARHNALVFGTLFVAGEAVLVWRWLALRE